jgi:hypothetical protein|tara:strand:+ start:118 stop:441 length:324 start_codon:yes stop_codon:yes gene_type:complete
MKHILLGLCLTLAFTSCQKEELELIEPVSQETCWNDLYSDNTKEYHIVEQTTFITNSCEPALPISSEYTYAYNVVFDGTVELILYTNVQYQNDQWHYPESNHLLLNQ